MKSAEQETSLSLRASYAVPQAPDDGYWLRLEQEGIEDDSATLEDAASVLDAAFGIEPCEETEPSNLADLEAAEEALRKINYVACGFGPDGSCEVAVRIFRSHQEEPYKLRTSGGEMISTTRQQVAVNITRTVEGASSLRLDYPAQGQVSASWMGNVRTNGKVISPPAIRQNRHTLYWAGQVTGTLQLHYSSLYDLARVKIFGNPEQPGEAASATLRCFYHGLVEELVPEIPEAAENTKEFCPSSKAELKPAAPATCYWDTVYHQLCDCSGKEVDQWTQMDVVTCPYEVLCPDGMKNCLHLLGTRSMDVYTRCKDEAELEDVNSATFFKEMCCETPAHLLGWGGKLPRCRVETSTYRGGHEIEGGIESIRHRYGDNVRIVPVAKTGGICGEKRVINKVNRRDCCEDVEPLSWNSEISPTRISPGSSALVAITGGLGRRQPYRWQVNGQGVHFSNGSRYMESFQRGVRIYTTKDACGAIYVSVNDGCSSTSGQILCTYGKWLVRGRFNPTKVYLDEGKESFIINCYANGHESGRGTDIYSGRYACGRANNLLQPAGLSWIWSTWAQTKPIPGGKGCWGGCGRDPLEARMVLDPIVGVFLVKPFGISTNLKTEEWGIEAGCPRGTPFYWAWGLKHDLYIWEWVC